MQRKSISSLNTWIHRWIDGCSQTEIQMTLVFGVVLEVLVIILYTCTVEDYVILPNPLLFKFLFCVVSVAYFI